MSKFILLLFVFFLTQEIHAITGVGKKAVDLNLLPQNTSKKLDSQGFRSPESPASFLVMQEAVGRSAIDGLLGDLSVALGKVGGDRIETELGVETPREEKEALLQRIQQLEAELENTRQASRGLLQERMRLQQEAQEAALLRQQIESIRGQAENLRAQLEDTQALLAEARSRPQEIAAPPPPPAVDADVGAAVSLAPSSIAPPSAASSSVVLEKLRSLEKKLDALSSQGAGSVAPPVPGVGPSIPPSVSTGMGPGEWEAMFGGSAGRPPPRGTASPLPSAPSPNPSAAQLLGRSASAGGVSASTGMSQYSGMFAGGLGDGALPASTPPGSPTRYAPTMADSEASTRAPGFMPLPGQVGMPGGLPGPQGMMPPMAASASAGAMPLDYRALSGIPGMRGPMPAPSAPTAASPRDVERQLDKVDRVQRQVERDLESLIKKSHPFARVIQATYHNLNRDYLIFSQRGRGFPNALDLARRFEQDFKKLQTMARNTKKFTPGKRSSLSDRQEVQLQEQIRMLSQTGGNYQLLSQFPED